VKSRTPKKSRRRQKRLLHCCGRLYEIRVSRCAWAKYPCQLSTLNIDSAKKLVRRLLDRCIQHGVTPDVIAIGLFKPAVAPEFEDRRWRCECHLIVGGGSITKQALQQAFTLKKSYDPANYLYLERIKFADLDSKLESVFDRQLQAWRHPYGRDVEPEIIQEADHEEFDQWRLDFPSREHRLFRYGCDRHYRKLRKKSRPQSVKKGHPNPIWLARFQFGSHPQTCACLRCMGQYPLN